MRTLVLTLGFLLLTGMLSASSGIRVIGSNPVIYVPEPKTVVLVGTGVIGFIGYARRRRIKS